MAGDLAVQLFTVREAAWADLSGTLQRIADIGYEYVEPFDFTTFDGLGRALRRSGLKAPTAHLQVLDLEPADQDAAFELAADLGIGLVIEPHGDASFWQDESGFARLAERINTVAAVADQHGVRFGYHNHEPEVAPFDGDETMLEAFAAHLDPKVALEVDTYWVVIGQADPAALLMRLGDRVEAIHVKDGPISNDRTTQVAVGSGAMPIRQIIEAAPNALHVVELDDSRTDRFVAIEQSYAYLTKEGLA